MSERKMLINYVPGEECRIAIVEDGRLEELYQERASVESHVGNIYKGKVVNVEPAIQAAFIEFGLERNGFLHISDLHPMYFQGSARDQSERVGMKTPRRERPPIQKCLRRGMDVLVQVLKEGIGTKGPTLTSYLSIPGRFIVMMPNMERLGVSRKVEDDEARREMRRTLDELNPPEGFGFIVRTAGIGRTKIDLKRDLAYLQRLWKRIEDRKKRTNVGELYTESDLVIRTIRDVFSSDIESVIVDHERAARRARDFLAMASPRSSSKVMLYRDPVPLFHRFDLEKQIEHINLRVVPMPSGGSLVIDSTEALVAIDVNSGRMRDHRDAETTAFKTNEEATDEICRQLRLRDLGGVVVNDLIDMRSSQNRRAIEQRFRNNLKRDRARTRIGTISPFGILEMTRQRMRPSLKKSLYSECQHCQGAGHVKSPESVVLDVMRQLALALIPESVSRVELTVSPDVAFQLLNRKRSALVALEQEHHKPVLVRVNAGGGMDYLHLAAFDSRGGLVDVHTVSAGEPDLVPVQTVSPLEADIGDEAFSSDIEESELSAFGPDMDEEQDPTVADPLEPEPKLETAEADQTVTTDELESEASSDHDTETEAPPKPRRRRRRRRGGRGRGNSSSTETTTESEDTATSEEQVTGADGTDTETSVTPEASADPNADPNAEPATAPTGGLSGDIEEAATTNEGSGENARDNGNTTKEPAASGRPRRRRRRGRRSRSTSSQTEPGTSDSPPEKSSEPSAEQAPPQTSEPAAPVAVAQVQDDQAPA